MAKFDAVKDQNGLTRRERGNRVKGYKAPSPGIPDGFDYIVDWFYELRGFCSESLSPIAPVDLVAWLDCQGYLLSSWEKNTLFAMDRVFRSALSEEMAYNEERRKAKS